VAVILVARSTGPEGAGLYSLAVLTGLTVAALFMFSFGKASKAMSSNPDAEKRMLLGNGLFISIVWGMIVTTLLVWKSDLILMYALPKLTAPILALSAVAVLPLLLFNIGEELLTGLKNSKGFNLYNLIATLLLTGSLTLFYHKNILTVEAAVSMWVGAVIITALLQLLSLWYRTGTSIKLDIRLASSTLLSGLKGHTANMSSFFRLRSDLFIIAYILPLEAVGQYAVALVMVSLLHVIPNSLVSNFLTDPDNENHTFYRPPVLTVARFGFFMAFGAGMIYSVIGWIIVEYGLGQQFMPTFSPFAILLFGAIFHGFGKVVEKSVMASYPNYYKSILYPLLFLINIGGCLLFIPRFGIAGAALSVSITHVLSSFLFLILYLNQTGTELNELFDFRHDNYKSLLISR